MANQKALTTAQPLDRVKMRSFTGRDKDVSVRSFKSLLTSLVSDNIVFLDSANVDDRDVEINLSGRIVSCKTEDAGVTVRLPDAPEEGFTCQIINYEGLFDVTITTVSGTTQIGISGETSQTIRRIGGAITVIYQTQSGSPEYVIIQDSRNAISNRITVTKASDLTGTLDSTKQYFIDGVIDMGTEVISVPSGGLTLVGYGFDVSMIISSEDNYTMFDGGGTSNGNLFISDLSISVSGTNSKVFDVDNSSSGNEALELNTVNFDNCTEIGTITGYRQALLRNIGLFGCQDGFIFDGTWVGGVRVETFIVRTFGSSGTIFSKGTSLTFGSRFFSNANLDVPSGSVGYEFEEANFTNDNDFQLQGGEFSGAGTYVNGITRASTKSKWRNNGNLLDTFVGGAWDITASAATVVASPATAYELNGTFVFSQMVHFSSASINRMVYDSTSTTRVDINAVLSLTSGNNNQVTVYIRQWDDSASSYSDINTTTITTNGAGKAENVSLLAFTAVEENDRIEVWVENAVTNNITAEVGSKLIISERQS